MKVNDKENNTFFGNFMFEFHVATTTQQSLAKFT